MPKCIICRVDFYRESHDRDGCPIEPAEPCWCGQMATGSLWEWDGWRAYRDWTRYRVKAFCGEAAYQLRALWETGHFGEPWYWG